MDAEVSGLRRAQTMMSSSSLRLAGDPRDLAVEFAVARGLETSTDTCESHDDILPCDFSAAACSGRGLFKRYMCKRTRRATLSKIVKGTAEPGMCCESGSVLTQPENDEIYESVHGRQTKFFLTDTSDLRPDHRIVGPKSHR